MSVRPARTRAVRFHGAGRPLTVDEVDLRPPGPAECLVRVGAVGLCGSDVHILQGHTRTSTPPLTLGHEIAGTRVEDGADVFVNPIVGCESCLACRRQESNLCSERRLLGIQGDGGLADFVVVPRTNTIELPPAVDRLSSPLIESAGTAHHALRRAGVEAGDVVIVMGVGGLGTQVMGIARARGATVVAVDVDPVALERARGMGAAVALDARDSELVSLVRAESSSDGVDVVVDCVGAPTTVSAGFELLRSGGSLAVIGIGDVPATLPPPATFVRRSLAVFGVYTYTNADIAAVIGLVESGSLELSSSVSRVVGLDGVAQALDDVARRRGSPVRVIVDPRRGAADAWSSDVP